MTDEFFMRKAIEQAANAFEQNEIPVGAVIIHNNNIIAKGYNLTEKLNDVTAHAEMQAFTAASDFVGGKYLKGCTLYVTLEPCVMCAGAAYWTQISKIVFGAYDSKRGHSLISDKILHPKTEIIGGILEDECAGLLLDFFKQRR